MPETQTLQKRLDCRSFRASQPSNFDLVARRQLVVCDPAFPLFGIGSRIDDVAPGNCATGGAGGLYSQR